MRTGVLAQFASGDPVGFRSTRTSRYQTGVVDRFFFCPRRLRWILAVVTDPSGKLVELYPSSVTRRGRV